MTELLTIPYSQRDAIEIMTDIQTDLTTITQGAWTDFKDKDLGWGIVKSLIGLFDFQAFYLDQQASECFLSLCRTREAAIRKSKELCYSPTMLTPAVVQVKLTFPAYGQQVIIPAGSNWLINSMTFTALDQILFAVGQTAIVTMTQGTSYTLPYTSSGQSWLKLVVPLNVANITVAVNGVLWTRIDSFIGPPTPYAYRLYQDTTGNTVLFGANINTYKPANNDVVTVNGIVTSGLAGNIQDINLPVSPLNTLYDPNGNNITNYFSGATISSSVDGTNDESIQSIRQNAPALYTTQGRLVTAADYAAFVRSLSGVGEAKAVGGEELGFYGDVYIVVYGTNPYLVDATFLANIKAQCDARSVVTIESVLSAPSILEVNLSFALSIASTVNQLTTNVSTIACNAVQALFAKNGGVNSIYNGQVEAAIVNANPGFEDAVITASVQSFATSKAGIITIPLCLNPVLTNCTLVNGAGATLFSGDGTRYFNNGEFNWVQAGQTDQVCTLTYAVTGNDFILAGTQIAILNSVGVSSIVVAAK